MTDEEKIDEMSRIALVKMNTLRQYCNKEKDSERADFAHASLSRSMVTRIQTAFIGALASFEATFGHLWGHGEMKLTEKQDAWRKEWQRVRKEILDKGNDQIKLAKADLNKYTVRGATIKVGGTND